MGITYIDGRRFKRFFVAGSRSVLVHRSELNRINVFPIPDGDTGTNLAMTLSAMADAAGYGDDGSLAEVANRIAEAGVEGARGNSGMMFAHFFLGFAEGLGDRPVSRAPGIAAALKRGADSLYQAVERPVEGTILTVARELGEDAERVAARFADLESFARHLLETSRDSLARTQELLPALKEAGVVDAGAKGLVTFLEGGVALLDEGEELEAHRESLELEDLPDAVSKAEFPEDKDRAFRYCTELVMRGDSIPERAAIAAALKSEGGSLIVARALTVAKVHIHTDDPDRAQTVLRQLGAPVELVKADDMRQQHARLQERGPRVRIVTDSTCDLPAEAIIEHDITVVPMTVMFGDQGFLDQVDLSHEAFVERLTDPDQPHPTTSQPAPADFRAAYTRAAEGAHEVVGLFVSSALSGTFSQAQNAAARFEGPPVRAFDTRTASLASGFQVLHAAEMAKAGKSSTEILRELERGRERCGVFLTVDRLDYLKRSGRVSRGRALLAGLLDLKPILTVEEDGAVRALDRVRGREALIPRVLALLRAAIPSRYDRLRMGIVHVICADTAEAVRAALETEFAPDEILIRPATSVLGAHTGPGAWAVVYQYDR